MERVKLWLGWLAVVVLVIVLLMQSAGCAGIDQPAGQQGWQDVKADAGPAGGILVQPQTPGGPAITIHVAGDVVTTIEQGRVTASSDSRGESAHSGQQNADNRPQTDATLSIPASLVP